MFEEFIRTYILPKIKNELEILNDPKRTETNIIFGKLTQMEQTLLHNILLKEGCLIFSKNNYHLENTNNNVSDYLYYHNGHTSTSECKCEDFHKSKIYIENISSDYKTYREEVFHKSIINNLEKIVDKLDLLFYVPNFPGAKLAEKDFDEKAHK